jgi:hypothetical protein
MDYSFFEEKPTIKNLDFSNNLINNLHNFDVESMSNIIFYGNNGSGKTTKIYAFLCSILDSKVYSLKNNEVEIDKRIFKFKSSIYHLEIDILELLNNEKIFFQNYLKEYISSRNIGLDIPKVIVILNSDKINKNSFLMLRKMIESNYYSCKFIFEVNNFSSVPGSIITRFLTIRINNPSKEEIEKTLNRILKTKKLNITKKNLNNIIEIDSRYKNYYDLNTIFCAFNYYIKTHKLLVNNYHNIIDEIILIITNKKLIFESLINLKTICEKIYINCYDVNELINIINNILINKCTDEKIRMNILHLSCECNSNIEKSTGKYFIHLENYFVKLMILLNKN